jgi:hypothetical protein
LEPRQTGWIRDSSPTKEHNTPFFMRIQQAFGYIRTVGNELHFLPPLKSFVASFYTKHQYWLKCRQDLGPALELFPEPFFLLFQETQAMISDLRQSDALDGSATRTEGVLALLTFPSKLFPMSLHQFAIDRLPLLFRHLLQSLEGLMRGLDVQMHQDRGLRYKQLIPDVPGSRCEHPAIVAQEQGHDPTAVPVGGQDRDSPERPETHDLKRQARRPED